MYDYPEPPPGRIPLIISGILKIIFGFFCLTLISSFLRFAPDLGLMFFLFGLEILTGILGICFAKAETSGKCIVLVVLCSIQLALYLISGFGSTFENPVLLIALAISIWFLISALRNLSNARDLEKEKRQKNQTN